MSTIKDIFDIILTIVSIFQSCCSCLAIIFGGVWGYYLFIKNRQKFPRANIDLKVNHRNLTKDEVLIHIEVIITNIGNVLIELTDINTFILQMIPLPDNAQKIPTGCDSVFVEWENIKPCIAERLRQQKIEIEPGENQGVQFDFIIPNNYQTIGIYSTIKNERKKGRDIGWDSTMFYDLIEKE